MTNKKVTASISALCLLSLVSIVVLVEKISVNQSSTLEQMLSEQDLAQISQYRALFGVESEPVLVAIQSPTQIPSRRLTRIEQSLLSLSAVSNTLSSASLKEFGASEAHIFSPAENAELIVLMISSKSRQLADAKRLSQDIQRTIDAQLQAGESSLVSGLPQIRAASWDISNSDITIILPLLVVITLLVTQLFFQSYIALGLSLVLTSLTSSICLALQLMVSAQINALIILVVPVIWAIATLDAFHLYSRAAIKTRQHHPQPAKAARAELFIPCLLTTATTAGCFITLTLMDTSPLIVSFGIWGAAGAIVAFVLTFTLGERLLSMQAINSVAPRWPGLFAFNLTRLAQHHSRVTIVVWASLAVCSILSMSHIEIATSFPQVFTSDHRIAVEINRLKALTGSDLNAIDVIIEASDSHGQSDTNLASAAVLTSNYLNSLDETQLVLPIGVMDEEFVTRKYRQWQTERNAPAGAVTGAFNDLSNWVNAEHRAVRLQVYLAQTSYKRKQEIVSWLSHFDETMLSHHQLTLSGSGYFYYLTEKRGITSLLSSSILSVLIVSATLYWITRHKAQALIAVCVSLIPGAIVAGCMAMLGIPWSIAMLPMPAVLLGLMNDDTIHILWSSQKGSHFGNRHFRRNALMAGPALLATTVILSGAVGTLFFSGIQTNQYLGLLIPLGLLLAFLCNLTLLPALNSLLHKSTQSKY